MLFAVLYNVEKMSHCIYLLCRVYRVASLCHSDTITAIKSQLTLNLCNDTPTLRLGAPGPASPPILVPPPLTISSPIIDHELFHRHVHIILTIKFKPYYQQTATNFTTVRNRRELF